MIEKRQSHFGKLLRQAREAADLSRAELSQRVGLDASHIYRIEVGDRRPSRESVLTLAEALKVDDEVVNKWLMVAGYAPMPFLSTIRGAVRTRGGRRRPTEGVAPPSGRDAARWAEWLEAMGLQETMIEHLLQAMETVGLTERQEVTKAISTTFSRVTETLETPVRTAVIPAAGGLHRIIAPHVMQHLLLSAMSEASESGISNIILVLAPGTIEPLYTPLKEALNLAIVPSIKLHYCEQAKSEGLGDAILQAKELVGEEPFVVLLPDDVVRERVGHYSRELHRMVEAFKQLNNAYLVMVAPVPKTKMPYCGVAQVGTQEIVSRIRPIVKLVEKPRSGDEICEAPQVFGIVGRYLLQPDIFGPLRELRKLREKSGEKEKPPVHLTEALDHLRQEGHNIYAFELEATRQDVGEVLGQASELIGDSSGSSSTS